MKGFTNKDKSIKFICPICKSVFIPSNKAIKERKNK